MTGTWWIVTRRPDGAHDGIAGFAAQLAAAIDARESAVVKLIDAWGDAARDSDFQECRGAFIQYQPGAFLRDETWRVLFDRLRARGLPIVSTVHEYWPPAAWSPRRIWQRAQCRRALRAVAGASSRLVATQPHAADNFAAAGIRGAWDTRVIPLGTNIEPVAGTDLPDRRRAQKTVVLFGQPAAFDAGLIEALAARWASRADRPRWIWLGRSADEMRAWVAAHRLPPVIEIQGGLDAAAVSQAIADADLALAPYVNGVATRRASLTVLIAHGRPIVGTDGVLTSDLLRGGGFRLSAEGDAPAFVANVEAVLADPSERDALAARRRALAAQAFAWPVISEAYLSAAAP